MKVDVDLIMAMSADLLDLLPDGWERDIYIDGCKLAEEAGEVCQTLVKRSKTVDDTADELADTIAVCAAIALKKGIDLNEAILRKHKERIQKRVDFHYSGKVPEGWVPRVK